MMKNELLRNAEGYIDLTAFHAIKNYEKVEEKMELYCGDIFRCKLQNGTEKEFVIFLVHDAISTVLMLSDDSKQPFHVYGMKYTNPVMLQYMFNDRFVDFVRSMNANELNSLLEIVVEGLGYEAKYVEHDEKANEESAIVKIPDSVAEELDDLSSKLTKAKAERDVYKQLYEDIIIRMMQK